MKFHAVLICCFLLCLLAGYGCKTKAIAVPVKQTHNVNNDSIEKLYIHDSIYIDRWHKQEQKGDTFIIHDSILYYKYKLIHDSIYVRLEVHDTIPSDPVIIEKPLTDNQIFLQRSGIALWILVAFLILAAIIGIVIKFAK